MEETYKHLVYLNNIKASISQVYKIVINKKTEYVLQKFSMLINHLDKLILMDIKKPAAIYVWFFPPHFQHKCETMCQSRNLNNIKKNIKRHTILDYITSSSIEMNYECRDRKSSSRLVAQTHFEPAPSLVLDVHKAG